MNEMRFYGILLRMMRLERGWNQEQLCQGICTVSYLSKIEHGKADPNLSMIQKLFQRMDVPWTKETGEGGQFLCEQLYDMILSDNTEAIEQSKEYGLLRQESISMGKYYVDYLVLRAYCCRDRSLIPEELYAVLDQRQRSLLLLLEDRTEEAINTYPCALTAQYAGITAYRNREYSSAISRLTQGCEAAARQGYAKIMMQCHYYLANCYLELQKPDAMEHHYRIAKRLAVALNRQDYVKIIDYNTAAAAVENGDYEKGYAFFSKLEVLTVNDCHKLAICCEKTGRRVEGIAVINDALDRADGIQKQMCELVRFRLKNKNYIESEEYGKLLQYVFNQIRKTMPLGYARFHLPWIEEWCIANRQYKLIYEILRSFPSV